MSWQERPALSHPRGRTFGVEEVWGGVERWLQPGRECRESLRLGVGEAGEVSSERCPRRRRDGRLG